MGGRKQQIKKETRQMRFNLLKIDARRYLRPEAIAAHRVGEQLALPVPHLNLAACLHDMQKILLHHLRPVPRVERKRVKLLLVIPQPRRPLLDLPAVVAPPNLDRLPSFPTLPLLVTAGRREHVGYLLGIVHRQHDAAAGPVRASLHAEGAVARHGAQVALHGGEDLVVHVPLPALLRDGDLHLAEPPQLDAAAEPVERVGQLVHHANDVEHDHRVQGRHGGASYAGVAKTKHDGWRIEGENIK